MFLPLGANSFQFRARPALRQDEDEDEAISEANKCLAGRYKSPICQLKSVLLTKPSQSFLKFAKADLGSRLRLGRHGAGFKEGGGGGRVKTWLELVK